MESSIEKDRASSESLLKLFTDHLTPSEIAVTQIKSKIAIAIESKRRALKLSQKQFAEKLSITQGMVSKMEKGDANFTIEELVDLAFKLDMDVTIELKN